MTSSAVNRLRAGALVVVIMVATGCSPGVSLPYQAPATLQLEPGGHEEGTVTGVVDGDTIEVEITGIMPGPGAGETKPRRIYDVRLMGIDTPETVHPQKPVQCFGREASAAAKAYLLGRQVRMLKDVEDTDQFDRLLRYVYVGAEMANARLVVNGYASAYTYPPNVRHADLFVRLQRNARENDRGLWASDTCNGEE